MRCFIINILKRNNDILFHYYNNLSAKKILTDFPDLCRSKENKPLSLRAIQKIIKLNRNNSLLHDNHSVQFFKEYPVKNLHLTVEEQFSSNLKIEDEEQFLKSCGFIKDNVIAKNNNFRTPKINNVFYVCEYQLKNNEKFIKYGISTKENLKNRIDHFIYINNRKGSLKSKKCNILSVLNFFDYDLICLFETKIKCFFKNHSLNKDDLPDGYTETIPYHKKDELFQLIKNIL